MLWSLFLVFILRWQFEKGAQGLAGGFGFPGMMPERPFFEALHQQEREPILLHSVLFLGGI